MREMPNEELPGLRGDVHDLQENGPWEFALPNSPSVVQREDETRRFLGASTKGFGLQNGMNTCVCGEYFIWALGWKTISAPDCFDKHMREWIRENESSGV